MIFVKKNTNLSLTLPTRYPRGRQLAFTLIQLMFIIAIGSAATVYGLVTQKNDIARYRTERLAYELQHILEASIVHYRSEKTWPTKMDDLVTKNLLPFVNNNKNPWGNDYNFSAPNGLTGKKFSVKTDVGTAPTASNALSRTKILIPNTTIVGTTIEVFIDGSNKKPNIPDGALLVKVNQGLQIGTDTSSSSNNGLKKSVITKCFSTSERNSIIDICSAYNRNANFEAALTGFNTGSQYDGKAVSNVQYGTDYNEIYIKKDTANLATKWCFDFVIAHSYSWIYTNFVKSKRGVYGEAIVFFYCEPAS